MRGAVLHAPGDVRLEERDDPKIIEPTDAIIRLSATCICGSDLWPYRGIESIKRPTPMGHEYVGIVEEIGSEVKNVKIGDFVVLQPTETAHHDRGRVAGRVRGRGREGNCPCVIPFASDPVPPLVGVNLVRPRASRSGRSKLTPPRRQEDLQLRRELTRKKDRCG